MELNLDLGGPRVEAFEVWMKCSPTPTAKDTADAENRHGSLRLAAYTTPYDPDPEVALHRLREQTFAAGDYLPPGGIMRFPRDLPPGSHLRFRLIMAVLQAIAAVSVVAHWVARGGPQPRTIDELLAMTGENGTHSILDITHTADIPEFGGDPWPLKHRHLKFVGTTTPPTLRSERRRPSREKRWMMGSVGGRQSILSFTTKSARLWTTYLSVSRAIERDPCFQTHCPAMNRPDHTPT